MPNRLQDAHVDHDNTGAVGVIAGIAITKGQILYTVGAVGRMTAYPSTAGNLDTGRLPLVAKHDIPVGGVGIAVPWMVWTEAYAHWEEEEAGLDGDVTAQPAAGSVFTVVSNDAGDTSVPITIYGIVAGRADFEVITTNALDGTDPVDGVKIFTAFHGATKAVTTDEITIFNNDPATIATLAAVATEAGVATLAQTDFNDGLLTYVAGGASTAKFSVWGTNTDGEVVGELITLAGTTLVPGTVEWASVDLIALGAVAAATTVTIAGTKALEFGPVYLDPDIAGGITQQEAKLGAGSAIVVGFSPGNGTVVTLSPTPANWLGVVEALAGDIDALEGVSATDVDDAIPVIADDTFVTILSAPLQAGKHYRIDGYVRVNSPAADDIKCQFTSTTDDVEGFVTFTVQGQAAVTVAKTTSTGLMATSGSEQTLTFEGTVWNDGIATTLLIQAAKQADVAATDTIFGDFCHLVATLLD